METEKEKIIKILNRAQIKFELYKDITDEGLSISVDENEGKVIGWEGNGVSFCFDDEDKLKIIKIDAD